MLTFSDTYKSYSKICSKINIKVISVFLNYSKKILNFVQFQKPKVKHFLFYFSPDNT